MNLPPVNKCLEPFKHPIPRFKDVNMKLMNSKWFSELDLDNSYEQLLIDGELIDVLTFTCSFGKVSMKVMPYGVVFGSDMFQAKVDIMTKAPVPKNVSELRSFLGLVQFYRNMIPHLSHGAHRL